MNNSVSPRIHSVTHAPFFQAFYWAFDQMDHVKVPATFEVCSFTHSWDNRGSRKISGCRGSGMEPSKRALVSSYGPSNITFPPFLRVSEILPFLCSSTPLFPPHLQSPQNFPMFSWEYRAWPLGYQEGRCWANCKCNYFLRFPTSQPMWSWSTNITVGQADDMQSQDCTLHYSTSFGKNQLYISATSYFLIWCVVDNESSLLLILTLCGDSVLTNTLC